MRCFMPHSNLKYMACPIIRCSADSSLINRSSVCTVLVVPFLQVPSAEMNLFLRCSDMAMEMWWLGVARG